MLTKIVQNPTLWRSLALRKAFPVSVGRSTATAPVINYEEEKQKLLKQLSEDLPKPYDGPERDLVNFPRRKILSAPAKVRFGFLPDEWFTFFHKKTGITGPYVFGAGFITFLLSKELYVIEEEFSTGCVQVFLIYMAIKYLGPMSKAWAFKCEDNAVKEYDDRKATAMADLEEDIESEKKAKFQSGMVDYLVTAKRENVMMQLETEYRSRAMHVYEQVKKRLDYHLELDNTRRKLEQSHMVEWIVSSVLKSITPQQEKETLQKCLLDLKALSARV